MRKKNSASNDLYHRTPEEMQISLGEQLRRLRLMRNFDQRTTAEKAGVSEKSLRNLEAGRGSTVETLLRVLRALDAADQIASLVPEPAVNPLALLKGAQLRQRVRRSRQDEGKI